MPVIPSRELWQANLFPITFSFALDMSQDINALFSNHSSHKENIFSESDIKSTINAIDAVARLSASTYFVIDLEEKKIVYKSKALLYVGDSTLKDKQRDCENPYWALLPERVLDPLIEVRKKYLHYCHLNNIQDSDTHYSTTDFPIMLNGKEFYVNQKFTPLLTYPDGTIKLGLIVVSHTNCKKLESNIVTDDGRVLSYDFDKRSYKIVTGISNLSRKEKMILSRMMKGMTNAEIAEELNICVSTVKTLRSRIFKKLDVKTMNEALTVVSKFNLI